MITVRQGTGAHRLRGAGAADARVAADGRVQLLQDRARVPARLLTMAIALTAGKWRDDCCALLIEHATR